MAGRLGLLLQALREHLARKGIPHFGRLVLNVNELRSPGGIALWAKDLETQVRRQSLDPLAQFPVQCHPWPPPLSGFSRLGPAPSKFSPLLSNTRGLDHKVQLAP